MKAILNVNHTHFLFDSSSRLSVVADALLAAEVVDVSNIYDSVPRVQRTDASTIAIHFYNELEEIKDEKEAKAGSRDDTPF